MKVSDHHLNYFKYQFMSIKVINSTISKKKNGRVALFRRLVAAYALNLLREEKNSCLSRRESWQIKPHSDERFPPEALLNFLLFNGKALH
jgi:hypothetical protein